MNNPLPSEIRAAREAAGLTQEAAGELIHGSRRAWQDYESGARKMHPGLWELFQSKAQTSAPHHPACAVRLVFSEDTRSDGMTRDDIIHMAREAGFRAGHIELYGSDPMPFVAPCSATDCMPELVRFAAIVAAAEREAALMAKLEAAEKERDAMRAELDALLAWKEEAERQEPVGVLHVGSWYGEELQDWEFEANQRACDKLNEEYVGSPTSLPLYALPGAQAQNVPKAVAYLDLGTGGYMDIGTDLTDEALAALPKGRHMLGIVGTYGVDGYVPAQNAPSVLEGYKLVPIEPTPTMITAALESSHAINAHRAEHCYRAMLAAAPEAKL